MAADLPGSQPLTPAADGFYHPSSEAELVELVRLANRRACSCGSSPTTGANGSASGTTARPQPTEI